MTTTDESACAWAQRIVQDLIYLETEDTGRMFCSVLRGEDFSREVSKSSSARAKAPQFQSTELFMPPRSVYRSDTTCLLLLVMFVGRKQHRRAKRNRWRSTTSSWYGCTFWHEDMFNRGLPGCHNSRKASTTVLVV